MQNFPPMLCCELQPSSNVSGWLAGEKLDGVRAILSNGLLFSRSGRLLPAPKAFLAGLPDACLDGELWAGRGGFQRAVHAVESGDFTGLIFCPFDAPKQVGGFQRRLAYVNSVCEGTSAMPVPHRTVRDYRHACAIAREFFEQGGEGAVFRARLGAYLPGCRSEDMLRFKCGVVSDEAVVESVSDAGILARWKGRRVTLRGGISTLHVGDIVTFDCYGFSESGEPRDAVLRGARNHY